MPLNFLEILEIHTYRYNRRYIFGTFSSFFLWDYLHGFEMYILTSDSMEFRHGNPFLASNSTVFGYLLQRPSMSMILGNFL